EAERPNLRHGSPAEGDEHERRDELGDRGADIADAENAERRALLLLRVPARDIGDADRERAARQPDPERRKEHGLIGRGVGQQEGRGRGQDHDGDIDDAPAVLVGPYAEYDAHQRAGQDRRADQQPELGLAEAELILYADTDDRENRPYGETGGERDRADGERPVLLAAARSE